MTILKSIVACLALANLVYFLWTHGVAPRAPTAAAPAAPAGTLKLVSESAGAARPGAAGSTPSVAPGSAADGVGAASGDSAAAAELAGATRCVTMGPYRDAGAAAQAASTLRTRGYDPRQRGVDEVPGGVWVYLPVPATPGGRDQLLAKLKAAGIGDALECRGRPPVR